MPCDTWDFMYYIHPVFIFCTPGDRYRRRFNDWCYVCGNVNRTRLLPLILFVVFTLLCFVSFHSVRFVSFLLPPSPVVFFGACLLNIWFFSIPSFCHLFSSIKDGIYKLRKRPYYALRLVSEKISECWFWNSFNVLIWLTNGPVSSFQNTPTTAAIL